MTEPIEKLLIDLMQHALGITDENPKSYRNYFCAAKRGKDTEGWRKLAILGYAKLYQKSGNYTYYLVTESGKEIVYERWRSRQVKPTRGQKRYRAWLALDMEESFIDFLTDPYFNEYRKSQGC